MNNNYDLEPGNQLLLLQAINSIEHGLMCLDYMTDNPNENTCDSILILKNRFEYFRECALQDTNCNMFLLDKAKQSVKNVDTCMFNERNNIVKQLENLRVQVLEESRKSE